MRVRSLASSCATILLARSSSPSTPADDAKLACAVSCSRSSKQKLRSPAHATISSRRFPVKNHPLRTLSWFPVRSDVWELELDHHQMQLFLRIPLSLRTSATSCRLTCRSPSLAHNCRFDNGISAPQARGGRCLIGASTLPSLSPRPFAPTASRHDASKASSDQDQNASPESRSKARRRNCRPCQKSERPPTRFPAGSCHHR